MAGTEDFDGFESNFPDSMLEVEVTEEEGEVKISQNDDHLPVNRKDFPPIPMFDLQSQTMTYKPPYGNSLLLGKQTSILKSKNPMPGSSYRLPSVQPSPMIFIHSNMLRANNLTIQPKIPGNAVPSISGIATPLPRPIMPKPARANVLANKLANKFMLEVFKPDFVKKVYTNTDGLPDVSLTGREEELFYKVAFKDVSKVQLCRLHCTICDKHIGCAKNVDKKISVHNMLKVLTCNACSEFYGDGNFPCDEGDHCEIYCRWCGQGGALICCSFCPKVFCKKCIRRNYSQSYVRAVEKITDWACFVCAQKPLWPHRAVCRALLEFTRNPNKAPARDSSMCCKPQPQPLNKKTTPATRKQPERALASPSKSKGTTSQASGKARVSANANKAGNSSGSMMAKVNSQAKSSVSVMKKPAVSIAPKTTGKATTSKATTSAPASRAGPASRSRAGSVAAPRIMDAGPSRPSGLRALAGVNLPRVISSPIYHGQTLITPPRNNMAKKMVPKATNTETSEQPVMVSVADAGNLDLTNIPVARIPFNMQGVILRLNFPDNKVQLVRLVRDVDPEDENAPFPIPKFGNGKNLDFLEGSLEDTFKLSRMLYERLMKIKEKLNLVNKYNKYGIYKSLVRRLSFIYEKARELMKELDENMLSHFESWESDRERENKVKVINLSDDEETPAEQPNNAAPADKPRIVRSDSEIEILTAALGKKILAHQRLLQRGLKREGEDNSRGNRTPEHVDVGAYEARPKYGERSRKKIKLSEEVDERMDVDERDPLAVSDNEIE